MHWAHEGSKVVSLMVRPSLLSGNIPSTHFCWRLSGPQAVARPEGLFQWNFPITPSGILTETFLLLAQYLNHLRHHVLPEDSLNLHIIVGIKEEIFTEK